MSQLPRRGGLVAVIAAITLAASPVALAGATPGQAPIRYRATFSCPLERIGSQLVKCDNLTGNGVPAPPFVPKQPHSRR